MILHKILEAKRIEIDQLSKIDPKTLRLADGCFYQTIQASQLPIIAELKSKSPSEGVIDDDYQIAKIAQAYREGGACALSVLTDGTFFGGSYQDISLVKAAVDLPVLCKEFIVDEQQVYHARLAGADACLLIVRCLNQNKLQELIACVEALKMSALVEVFDESELQVALDSGARLIGANNRNLDTLHMDTNNIERLFKLKPQGITMLSLSGAKTPKDLQYYASKYDGVLAGTALMRSQNKAAFLQEAFHLFLDSL